MTRHLDVGRAGEDLAVRFLKKKGYKLLERNHESPFGEIDLIFMDKGTVVFVEVKTRTSEAFGRPSDAVGPAKRKRIARAAKAYLSRKGYEDRKARMDVLSVDLSGPEPKIEHLADAFDD
jgi:putative endonuclease